MSDMAQIPYIAHLARMHKAKKREQRLKKLIIITNVFWIVTVALLSAMR